MNVHSVFAFRSEASWGVEQSSPLFAAFLSLRSTCSFVMLTIRFSLTRLETRTKESNIYASIWVVKTLVRNESNFGRNPSPGALSTDHVSDLE